MEAEKIKKRIAELVKQLNFYNHLYYQEHQSAISDYDFDMLMSELIQLEKDFPAYQLPDSPTHRIGGNVTKEFISVPHQHPMLSLSNTYSREELEEFHTRVSRHLQEKPFQYVCELKFDGVSISLIYENGLLVRGVTRGDGMVGDDTTINVKTIQSIPLKISSPFIPERMEIRGEIYMSHVAFSQLNQERKKLGKDTYANPRNTASGTLKMQDSKEVAQRKLDCYVYSLMDSSAKTQIDAMGLLEEWNFPVSKTYRLCQTLDEVVDFIDEWEYKRHELPLDTDGVVIKINEYDHQAQLGQTAKSPRWAIAYKYQGKKVRTQLKSITYQVGRTGAITPVAELVPVLISGTTVKRVSLHNANEIVRLGLHEKDYVWVEKGGDIIPKITEVDTSMRDQSTAPIVYITHCPNCNSKLIREEALHYCINTYACVSQITGRIEHFIQRKAMNISALGGQTINKLFELDLLRTPADLYSLTVHDLLAMEKVKEKTAQNILAGIEASKSVPFESFLYALGIRFVGETVAKKLAQHFENIDALAKASYDDLMQVPDVGKRIAISIVDFFKQEASIADINRFKQADLQMAIVKNSTALSDKLKGKTFVVSGTFSSISREDLHRQIRAHGGQILSSVSGKLDYLLAGENMGPAKRKQAEKLGVKIISLTNFQSLLQ